MKNIPVVPTSVTKTPVDKTQLWQTAKREREREGGGGIEGHFKQGRRGMVGD